MRIILLNLNLMGVSKLRWTGEHLGIGYLASSLRSDGHSVKIIDADLLDLHDEIVLTMISDYQPDLMGLTSCDANADHLVLFTQELRRRLPKVRVCVGGHYATFSYRYLLSHGSIDYVCRGEGEDAIVKLADGLEKGNGALVIHGILSRVGLKKRIERPKVIDLDRLPFPARDTTRSAIEQGFPIPVSSSRGCYGSCRFCSICAFYGSHDRKQWRAENPERVVFEINDLKNRFGVTEVVFVDDNFVGPAPDGPARAFKIAELLYNKRLDTKFSFSCRANDVDPVLFANLKKTGLNKVFIGFESFDDVTLRNLHKNATGEQNRRAIKILNSLGISINPSLIMFTPWTTIGTIQEAYSILEEQIVSYDVAVLFSHLWYLSGTLLKRGRSTTRMSPNQIYDKSAALFYSILLTVMDRLLAINSLFGRMCKERTYLHLRLDSLYEEFGCDIKQLFAFSLERYRNQSSPETVSKDVDNRWQKLCQKSAKLIEWVLQTYNPRILPSSILV